MRDHKLKCEQNIRLKTLKCHSFEFENWFGIFQDKQLMHVIQSNTKNVVLLVSNTLAKITTSCAPNISLSHTHTIKARSIHHQFKDGCVNGKATLNQSTARSFHTKCSLSYYKFKPLITALIYWSTSLQPVYTQPQHTAATAIHLILSKEDLIKMAASCVWRSLECEAQAKDESTWKTEPRKENIKMTKLCSV